MGARDYLWGEGENTVEDIQVIGDEIYLLLDPGGPIRFDPEAESTVTLELDVPVSLSTRFAAWEGQLLIVHGTELHRLEGDTFVRVGASTRRNASSSELLGGVEFAGATYFSGPSSLSIDGELEDYELWKYDGVSFTRAADIAPGDVSSRPMWLFSHDDALWFSASGDGPLKRSDNPESYAGRELWQFDGETAEMVADLAPGSWYQCLDELDGDF